MPRGIIIRGLIEKFGDIGQDQKTVREPFRNPELAPVFGGKANARPFAAGRRTFAHVDCHVKDFADNTAHQFSLWLPNLVMKPAQHAFERAGMIVLHSRPGISVATTFMLISTFQDSFQIVTVTRFGNLRDVFMQLTAVDEALAIGDLFQTRNFEPLTRLQ